MELHTLDHQRLAYLDTGGRGGPLIMLHGHFSRARYFAPLIEALSGKWRIIALDQRGHGKSRHAAHYTRESYREDIRLLMDTLRLESAIFVGFSLGGVNAYQFAACYPTRVRSMIIEDVGAVVKPDDPDFILSWPRRFPSMRAAYHFLRENTRGSGLYFMESLVEFADGWGFCFDHEGLVQSQKHITGDWWTDWLATTCPALLIHGGQSTELSATHAAEMVARRPNTRLVTMPTCGHGVLHCDFAAYKNAVESFLHQI